MLLQVKDLNGFSESGLTKFCTRLYQAKKHPFKGHGISSRKRLRNNALKKNELEVKLRLLKIAKAHFKYTIWFMIIGGPSCGWTSSFYRYENLYTVLTEGRNFNTFLKENYSIAWKRCYC